jgi:hypothetical protein
MNLAEVLSIPRIAQTVTTQLNGPQKLVSPTEGWNVWWLLCRRNPDARGDGGAAAFSSNFPYVTFEYYDEVGLIRMAR